MKTIKFLALLAFLVNSYSSSAQLYFKNKTSEPVWVAYAKWNDSKSEDHWFTKGWYKVEPGQTKKLAEGIGLQDYCYYFAETAEQKKKYDGNAKLLVDRSDAFRISNADKSYQAESNSNYEWEGFRKFTYARDILGTKVKQTIILEY